MYNTTVRIQKRRKRRLFLAGAFIVLLAAAAGILYRLPVTLQDISRIIQLVAGKFSSSPADNTSAGDVLRGTIYDRNFKEFSVSYHLFSLYVHPAKIDNHGDAAQRLAAIVGVKKETVEALIKQSKRVVALADDLDADQVKAVEQLQLEGVFCKGTEERYYPEHTAAAHVLGYTSDGIGLSGVERKYDILLQPGEYQPADASEVDFQGNIVLGQKSTDLVLTLDIDLQKKIDKQLHSLLAKQGAAVGMGLLMDPASGRILALSNQPSFDPNYFWQAGEGDRLNRMYTPRFDPALVRPLLIRTAAKIRGGEQPTPLLPSTIAAPDFGLSEDEYDDIIRTIGFIEPVLENLPSDMHSESAILQAGEERVSVMQLGVGLASLINGGWRISPTFLDSVYDLQSGQRFTLREESAVRTHVLSPTMGVIVRRELLSHLGGKQKEKALTFSEKSVRVVSAGTMSRYVQQQLFVGMIPKKKPEMLLVIALEQDMLAPLQKREKKSDFVQGGKILLTDLYAGAQQEQVAKYSPEKNRANLARFLISRGIEYTRSSGDISSRSGEMPRVVGMSLRKGLQQLNQHNLRITIKGTGQIVAQSPGAGERLNDVEVCRLTLE